MIKLGKRAALGGVENLGQSRERRLSFSNPSRGETDFDDLGIPKKYEFGFL
jgi:hypothetical protein